MEVNSNKFNINKRKDLFKKMLEAEDFCYEYNSIRPSKLSERNKMLREFLGEVNGNFLIFSPFKCDVGENIKLGNNVFIGGNCTILDFASVTFGDDVWVGANSGFYTSGHDTDSINRINGEGYANPIHIGNNVWIGASATIVCSSKSGIEIGENSIIATGSVINKNVPSNVLVAGNPFRVIRQL